MTKFILGLIFCIAFSAGLSAAETVFVASESAFPSVQEGGGARAIALGSTYVGIAEGSASLLWNPAGLASLYTPEISLNHTSALLGADQEIAIVGIPVGQRQGLGISLLYEDNGSFDGRDANGVATGGYSAQAYGASLGWGLHGPDGLSLGATLKADRQDLAGSALNAVAGDLGLLWDYFPNLTLGAAYTNLGPRVGDRELSQGLRVGISSYIQQETNHEWLFALSEESLTYGASSLHAGIEFTLNNFFSLRAGYSHQLSRVAPEGMPGWSFGGGVILSDFCVDYAIVPLDELGNMQRLSLTYAFGTRSSAPSHVKQRSATKLGYVPGGRYVVQNGDSLWTISAKYGVMGDSFLWPLLYTENGNVIGDPDQIQPGQKLKFKDYYTPQEVDAAEEKAKNRPAYAKRSSTP